MNRFAKLSGRWLSHYGVSLGISDVTPSEILTKKHDEAMKEACELILLALALINYSFQLWQMR